MTQPQTQPETAPAVRFEWRPRALIRVGWTVVSLLVVESLVFGLSVLPAALFWDSLFARRYPSRPVAIVALSMAFIPAYLIFAFGLMMLSAWATGLLGWRSPRDSEMRIADLDWPLLDWARYMASVHVARLFAGAVFRATPLWTLYLRANGARLGKGVYINSLAVNDHNLLEFDDHVVIGDDVHLSGHTVERGIVKTGRVRLHDGVTIGLCSIVDIDVEIGPRAQVGALSLVPKHARLEGGAVYVGIPARPLSPPAILGTK
jgi:acetyltransferase-like isoleucine patch superfamily enzyme